MTTAMTAEEPVKKDEPWITLPTLGLIVAIVASCAVMAGVWAGAALALGFGGEIAATGALGAGLAMVFGVFGMLVIFPWIAKPASTSMLLWLVADLLAMLASLATAYMLYSATFLQIRPLMLGVALAYFIALLAKVTVVASYMKKHFP